MIMKTVDLTNIEQLFVDALPDEAKQFCKEKGFDLTEVEPATIKESGFGIVPGKYNLEPSSDE